MNIEQRVNERAAVLRERYFRDSPQTAEIMARESPPAEESEDITLDPALHARAFDVISKLSFVGGRQIKAVVVTLL